MAKRPSRFAILDSSSQGAKQLRNGYGRSAYAAFAVVKKWLDQISGQWGLPRFSDAKSLSTAKIEMRQYRQVG